jgi:hypothetical protein
MLVEQQYCGEFDSWSNVELEFSIPAGKEPKYVFANYNTDCYNGDALVVYSNNKETFFVVEGAHCSCYGLEGQWDPSEHSYQELLKMKNMGGSEFHNWLDGFKE